MGINYSTKKLRFFSDRELEDRRRDLVDIKSILEKVGVRFLLMDGALLGAMREKNFIRWDWDVELGLYTEEVSKRLPSLIQELYEQGFEIVNINPKFRNFKVNIIKRGTKFSLTGYYLDGKWCRRGIIRLPARFFSDPGEIEFLGEKYLCVSPPEEFLEYVYGDWHVPKKETDSNKYLNDKIYDHGMRRRLRIYDALISLKNRISMKIEVLKRREVLFKFMLRQAVKPGSVFIDIGSDDGNETITALKASKGKLDVFLIEPDQINLLNARQNIQKYAKKYASKVHYLNCAVSDKTGKGTFFRLPDAPHLNSVTHTREGHIPIEANFIALEDLIRQNGIKPPVLIKMDIEGHEVNVLSAALDYLCSMDNISILLEVHPHLYSQNNSFEDVLRVLFENGYDPVMVESSGVAIPESFRELDYKPIKIDYFSTFKRGLYQNLDKDFVLKVASHPSYKEITSWGIKYMGKKDCRSLLLTKEVS